MKFVSIIKKNVKRILINLYVLYIYIIKKKYIYNKKISVLLFQIPTYGNLGDQAIAVAERLLLKEYQVCEFSDKETRLLVKHPKIFTNLVQSRIICLPGGGNLGTLWFDGEEVPRRRILQLFSQNPIIIFPQTIYYEDSEWGNKELDNSIRIYNSCPNLIITARERYSYEIMKKIYRNVYLVPDMVLYLKPELENVSRHGCLTLFRKDLEKTMQASELNAVLSCLKDKYEVEEGDTVVSYSVTSKTRENELYKFWNIIHGKELVVTDRLHGMVFAAITGTPCAVFNSKSPKVRGIYELAFSNCEYIEFVDSIEELSSFIDECAGKTFEYDNQQLLKEYDLILNVINKFNV